MIDWFAQVEFWRFWPPIRDGGDLQVFQLHVEYTRYKRVISLTVGRLGITCQTASITAASIYRTSCTAQNHTNLVRARSSAAVHSEGWPTKPPTF